MTPAAVAVNPYVGLRPFDRDDSLYYFGRREQTSELLEQLYRNRFLAVVGSSGCGKSSLVRAGLIPALLGGFLVNDRDQWLVAVMKPGDAPMLNLASALCAAAGRSDSREAQDFEKALNEDQAEAVIERMRPVLGRETNLLILVDQFEEIFSFRGCENDDQFETLSPALRRERGRTRAEASNFVSVLLALAPADLPVYVVLTMRSDFLGDCEVFYGLPEAMNRSRYLVPRLTRQQLRDAVQGPALLSGVKVTPRLLDTVLNDLGGRSDQLPVLQHALFRTWEEWNRTATGPLDLQHYEKIGGLQNALSLHATEALRDEDIRETELVFQCLTDTDPGQRRVRRPAHLQELIAVCGGKAEVVRGIVDRFRGGGRNFLVTSTSRGGDLRIDISHESLIRRWPMLRQWIDAERVSRDHYLDLVCSARKGSALLQDPDLAIALKWKHDTFPTPAWAARYDTAEGDFEAAMTYLSNSQQAAAAAIRRRKRTQITIYAACALTILSLSAAMIYALRARNAAVLAEERAKVAWDEAESSKQQLNDYAKQIESVLSKMPSFVRSAVTPPAITPATATSGVHAAAAVVRPSRRPSPAVSGYAKPPARNRPATGAERPSSAQAQVPAAQPVPPRDLPVQTAQPTGPVAASSPPDARESAAPELRRSAPRTPVTLSVHKRSITYSKVSLNFQGNAITVSPGQVFTVSFHWEVRVPAAPECPGCYVQYYYGIGGKAGGESRCFVSDIMGPNSSKSGDVKGTLQAPRAEGLYFITQGTTWEYSCQEKKVAQSADPGDAIAVILVR